MLGVCNAGSKTLFTGRDELWDGWPTGTGFAPVHGWRDHVAKYGKAAEKTITSAMRRRKKGTLKSSSGQTVKSRKQAIAIGISEARAKGAKVPPKPRRKSAKKK
jgi:hypothetical protein